MIKQLNFNRRVGSRAIYLFLIIVVVFLFEACSDNHQYYYHSHDLPQGWHKDKLLSFTLPELDSLKSYGLQFVLRNTEEYPYSNIFLITTLQAPNGKAYIDTLEYTMATAQGEWLGKGITGVKESLLWYKDHYQFKEEGKYILSVRQAMRHPNRIEGLTKLVGITDFGIRICQGNTHAISKP